ncbi:MAG: glycosyltransferase family 39 protein [Planctomyces sp.]|nr:glycosyltransferase family 39 protein [Planctomyces sp.]
MKPSVRDALLIVAAAAAMSLSALGQTRLWDEDEAFFAAAAAEMHRRGDWVVPTFNDELFAHKPPFMYWMMRVGFALFGLNEFGARFGSAVFSILTALVAWRLGARLFSRRAGLLAGLILPGCLMWGVVSRAATADCYLAFFTTLAMLIYVRAVFPAAEGGMERTAAPQSLDDVLVAWLPGRWSTFAAMYGAMALAVLVKGPIGMLLPGAAIGLFVLSQAPCRIDAGQPAWRRLLQRLRPFVGRPLWATFWQMRPLTAIGMLLLVAGPWFMLVHLQTQGAFLREFFGVHNVGRFLTPMENHRGPIVYYIPVMLIGCFPWTMFTMPTLAHLRNGVRDPGSRARFVFVLCWLAWMVGFFSIARTKLPNYVLPAYPAVALLIGAWVDAWLARREATWSRWPQLAFGTLAGVGLALLIALPAVGLTPLGGRPLLERLGVNGALTAPVASLAWLGVIPLAGGLLAMELQRRDLRMRAAWCASLAGMAFTATVLIGAAGVLDPHQTSFPLTQAAEATRRGDAPQPLGAYRHFPPSLVFYAGRRVERLRTLHEAAEFLSQHPEAALITTDSGIEQLEAGCGPLFQVVDARPRFPRTGDVFVIERRPGTRGRIAVQESGALR